jgi:hypothetical protein
MSAGSRCVRQLRSAASNATSKSLSVNLEAGHRIGKHWRISAALYNAFDSKDNDITYYYESQLANETESVEDIHFHPVEPRTLRMTLQTSF